MKNKEVIIDDTWKMSISSNDVQLIECVESTHPKANNPYSDHTRGYYAHIDDALRAYLRKSINPNFQVFEILDKIDYALSKIAEIKERV